MVLLVKNKLEEITILCQKYRVKKLWIFGSAVIPEHFRPDSDLDFLYQFDDNGTYDPSFPYAANWSDMLTALRDLFDREVQLIAYGPFKNPWFRDSVEATKQLIYDQNTPKVAV
ncbi:MAG: nucleotidyltransferase domain-containing protein [Bacteroidia bacterium]